MKLPLLSIAIIAFTLANPLNLHAMVQSNPFAQGIVEALCGKKVHQLTNDELTKGICCCDLTEECVQWSGFISLCAAPTVCGSLYGPPGIGMGIAIGSCLFFSSSGARKQAEACKKKFKDEFYRRQSPPPTITMVRPQKKDPKRRSCQR